MVKNYFNNQINVNFKTKLNVIREFIVGQTD